MVEDSAAPKDVNDPQGAEGASGSFAPFARGQFFEMVRLPHLSWRSGLLSLGLLAVVWAGSGFYRVQPDQQGIVLQFGKWMRTENPGIHYYWPYPVETVTLPRTTQINTIAAPRRARFPHLWRRRSEACRS